VLRVEGEENCCWVDTTRDAVLKGGPMTQVWRSYVRPPAFAFPKKILDGVFPWVLPSTQNACRPHDAAIDPNAA
jgi:hypothetical protein